jgi:hypothetical protein
MPFGAISLLHDCQTAYGFIYVHLVAALAPNIPQIPYPFKPSLPPSLVSKIQGCAAGASGRLTPARPERR